IYRRIRRNIGRQRLQPRRIIVRVVILGVLSLFIILAGSQNLHLLMAFGAGILGGAALGFLGLRLTQFESSEEGHFYKPDTRIGVAISLLLAGRLIYRMAVLNSATLAPGHPPRAASPLTFFIIGLTFGYYIVYSIGLFAHARNKPPATAAPAPLPPL
ncbi:MAG: DUF1453 domain-containing protein, partial [Limisphaerales bacterium]